MLGRRAVVVAAAALGVLAVLWAASAPRPAPDYSSRAATTTLTPRAPLQDPFLPGELLPLGATNEYSTADTVIGTVIAGLFLLALVVGVLVLLVRLVRALLAAWRARRVVATDDTAPPDLARVAEALGVDAEGRLLVLARGTPAQGIVAAWDRLEQSLRAAGLDLPASRTSSETTVAALRRYGLDADPLIDLGRLYREASWSTHALTESHRTRAEEALRALDAELARHRVEVPDA